MYTIHIPRYDSYIVDSISGYNSAWFRQAAHVRKLRHLGSAEVTKTWQPEAHGDFTWISPSWNRWFRGARKPSNGDLMIFSKKQDSGGVFIGDPWNIQEWSIEQMWKAIWWGVTQFWEIPRWRLKYPKKPWVLTIEHDENMVDVTEMPEAHFADRNGVLRWQVTHLVASRLRRTFKMMCWAQNLMTGVWINHRLIIG